LRNRSRTDVSTELGLGLVSPEHTIVPLRARLSYGRADPYALRMAFYVGTDDPVEWTLSRDLLASALYASEGIGDVRAWPATASCGPAADGASGGAAAGHGILNIAMSSPFGQARFEVSAEAIEAFLARTYQLVPAGQESGFMDFDAELTELLSQA
jgi:hypothetical protein